MTLQLTFHNPITNNFDIICLVYPQVDYNYYLHHKEINNDVEICNSLLSIIQDMDCTKVYNGVQKMSTKYPRYVALLSDWYFYFSKLHDRCYLANSLIDTLIKRHVDNLIFECTEVLEVPKVKRVNTKKKKKIKAITHDMFTGERIDLEINPETGEEKVIKPKRPKVTQIKQMTFSFKKI